jgi:hypothetical protein
MSCSMGFKLFDLCLFGISFPFGCYWWHWLGVVSLSSTVVDIIAFFFPTHNWTCLLNFLDFVFIQNQSSFIVFGFMCFVIPIFDILFAFNIVLLLVLCSALFVDLCVIKYNFSLKRKKCVKKENMFINCFENKILMKLVKSC